MSESEGSMLHLPTEPPEDDNDLLIRITTDSGNSKVIF